MGKTNIIQNMMPDEAHSAKLLNLDDTFEFNCRRCGKCCHNRNDLILTPYDLFGIASHYRRSPKEIAERYCGVIEGSQSKLPIPRVKPIPPKNTCPFLYNRKCGVHAMKPVLCRAYPLARVYRSDGMGYIYNGANCKNEPRSITVRDWMGSAASDEAVQAGKMWFDIASFIAPLIQPEKYVSKETRLTDLETVFNLLWLEYDMSKPFLAQFQDNCGRLREFFAERGEWGWSR